MTDDTVRIEAEEIDLKDIEDAGSMALDTEKPVIVEVTTEEQ